MAKRKKKDIDFSALQEKIQRQFQGLDPQDPSLWPVLPRAMLLVFIAAAVAGLMWFIFLRDY